MKCKTAWESTTNDAEFKNEFNVRVQWDKIGRLTEVLDNQIVLVKIKRNKARVTEELIREMKQTSLTQPFTLSEKLFVHEKVDKETRGKSTKSWLL